MRIPKRRMRISVQAILTACSVFFCDLSIAQDGADCEILLAKYNPVPTAFTTANFLQIGSPSGGYPSITDLVTFNGKMYLSTSNNPLSAFGTNVFYTSDGISYTKVLEDAASQGYLRIGIFDGKLWIPDGDPNGLDPSFVYISSTGAPSSFTKTNILAAVHSFDVIKFNNQFYVSNGMGSGQGGLCKYDGSNTWNSVYQSTSSVRMKYMAVVNGKLVVANRNSAGDIDGFVFSGDPGTSTPVQVNVLSGATNSFRMFTSSLGKLFWAMGSSTTKCVKVTTDGVNWQQATTLDGKIVSDFAEFNGNLYALATDGLWESTDHFTFTNIASPPAADPTCFTPAAVGGGVNPDAPASMEAFNGSLWCGSSRNGKIYKVDFVTSVPGTSVVSNHFHVTGHSIVFQMESSAAVEVRVYALTGSLVKSVSLGAINKGDHEIRLDELKEGVYLLEATIGNEVNGVKFVRR